MNVDKTTKISVRFDGGEEYAAGVAYVPLTKGAKLSDARVELCDKTIPKGLKGTISMAVEKEGSRKQVLGLGVQVSYVKNQDTVLKLFYPPAGQVQEEIDKAKKLYKAGLDAVILVCLKQEETSESYHRKRIWVKDKTESDSAGPKKKSGGRGRKAAKKSAGGSGKGETRETL
jgi:hypothetical protein